MTVVRAAAAASPVLVAQRLCDLLLAFPAAAVNGVRWSTLLRKYEERHSAKLEIAALGHATPLAAATALLWDVLRVADAGDTSDPVVACEDGVVLAARPSLLGCWPSLYQALCQIVCAQGTKEDASVDGSPADETFCLLLSQLRPLLQSRWHPSFDESVGFFGEDGAFVRTKKMKHLVQGVLQWRAQRRAWRAATGKAPSAVDDAVELDLELVASRRHNDLVLRCAARGRLLALAQPAPPSEPLAPPAVADQPAAIEGPPTPTSVLQLELAHLRAENEALRCRNQMLARREAEVRHLLTQAEQVPSLPEEVFDDPFEPPPECLSARAKWLAAPSTPSTVHTAEFSIHSGMTTPSLVFTPRGFELHSGVATPHTQDCSRVHASGSDTPVLQAPTSASQVNASFVPVWFSVIPRSLGDRMVIPSGIVQRFKAQFEHIEAGPEA